MSITPNFLPWLYIILCISFFAMTTWYVIKVHGKRAVSAKKTPISLSDTIRSFDEALDGVGKDFVSLIHHGFITSPKMGNYANDFRDNEQCEDFSRSIKNPAIIKTVKIIGETYGQFYL